MLKRLIDRADRWVHGGHGILSYHRIATVKHDPWGLAVPPERFDEHLQVLRQHFRVMTVERMARDLRAGRLPRRAIAVTFDDGYLDNLLTAKPLLERNGVPATVFLCTGLLSGHGFFWWDALLRVLMEATTLPPEISMVREAGGLTFQGKTARAVAVDHHGEGELQRLATYRSLWEVVRLLPFHARQEAVTKLAVLARVELPSMPDERPMSRAEAATLADGGLIEVGAHTVTHPVLPELAVDRQREEIARSKADCEELASRPVTSFAYPHGRWGPETENQVREAGFFAACTTAPGFVRKSNDPLLLPRIQVRDWDGAEFERRLETLVLA